MGLRDTEMRPSALQHNAIWKSKQEKSVRYFILPSCAFDHSRVIGMYMEIFQFMINKQQKREKKTSLSLFKRHLLC